MVTSVGIAANLTIELDPRSDSGLSNSDKIINDTKSIVVFGRTAPDETVNIQNDNNVNQWGEAKADSQGSWTFTFSELSNPYSDGSFQITVSRSQFDKSSMRLVFDNERPTIFVIPLAQDRRTSTQAQSNEAGKVFLIREALVIATYDDILSLGSEEQYEAVTLNDTGAGNMFTADIPLDRLPDATYKAYAVDLAGNISESSETVKIDNIPATLTVTPATSGVKSQSVSVQSNESGNVFLINESEQISTVRDITNLAIHGRAAEYRKIVLNATASDTVFKADISFDGLAEGAYKVYAVDPAGNLSASTETVTIDNTPPTVSMPETLYGRLTNPSAGKNNTVQVESIETGVVYLVKESIVVNDPVDFQGMTNAREFRTSSINFVAASNGAAAGYFGTMSLGDLDEGLYKAYVVDSAGNMSQRSSGTVTIDRTPPAASAPDLKPLFDSGISDSDNITNIDTDLTFLVTGAGDNTVTLWETFENSPTYQKLDITAYHNNINLWIVKINDKMNAGNHTIISDIRDKAGNYASFADPASASTFTIDTLRPSIVSIAPVGNSAADATSLSFAVKTNEAVNSLSLAGFVLTTAGNTTADIIEVTGSGSDYLVKVGNIRGDGSLRLDVNPVSAMDNAGNLMKDSYTSGPVHDVFFPEPSDPLVRFSIVDGVTVKSTTNIMTTAAGDGSPGGKLGAPGTGYTLAVDIAPIDNSTRIEVAGSGSNTTADIPLNFSRIASAETIVTVSLPDGIGLRAEGSLPLSNADAVTQLTDWIASVAGQDLDSGEMHLVDGAKLYFEDLAKAGVKKIAIEKIILTSNTLSAPGTPVTIRGNTSQEADTPAQALIIDATQLPDNTVVTLKDVDFSILVGSATFSIAGEGIVYAGVGDQKILLDVVGGEAHGGAGNDTLTGKNGNDRIFGDAGDDKLTGGAGRDLICGGSGVDTAVYTGRQSDYTVDRNGSIFTVRYLSDPTHADTLVNVESLRFDDGTVSLEYGFSQVTTPEFIAGLYAALLGRAPDNAELQKWSKSLDSGGSGMRTIAAQFARTTNFDEQYSPALSPGEFVGELYQNILGIEGDAMSRQYWTRKISEGGMSRTDVLSDLVAGTLNYIARVTAVTRAELLDAAEAWNMFSNKVAVGLHYAAVMGDNLDDAVNPAAYQQSVAVLSGVTDSSQSVEDALLKIVIIGDHAGYVSVVA